MSIIDLTNEINKLAEFSDEEVYKVRMSPYRQDTIEIVNTEKPVAHGKLTLIGVSGISTKTLCMQNKYNLRTDVYPVSIAKVRDHIYCTFRTFIKEQLRERNFKRPEASGLIKWFDNNEPFLKDKLAALYKYYFLRNDTKAEHVMQTLEILMRKSNVEKNSNQ